MTVEQGKGSSVGVRWEGGVSSLILEVAVCEACDYFSPTVDTVHWPQTCSGVWVETFPLLSSHPAAVQCKCYSVIKECQGSREDVYSALDMYPRLGEPLMSLPWGQSAVILFTLSPPTARC